MDKRNLMKFAEEKVKRMSANLVLSNELVGCGLISSIGFWSKVKGVRCRNLWGVRNAL